MGSFEGNVVRNSLIGGVTFGLLALCPLFLGPDWTEPLTDILIYSLLAISIALVWTYGPLLMIGQALFFILGGYVIAIFTKDMMYPNLMTSYIGLLFAVIASAICALILARLLFAGEKITTAGYITSILVIIALMVEWLIRYGDSLIGQNSLAEIPPSRLIAFGLSYELWDRLPDYYGVLCVVAATFFGANFLIIRATKPSPMLKAFFTPRSDAPNKQILIYSVSAAISGLAGGLFVIFDGFVSPLLVGSSLLTETLTWALLGGKEALLAIFLGEIFARSAESWLIELVANYWILLLGIIIVIGTGFYVAIRKIVNKTE